MCSRANLLRLIVAQALTILHICAVGRHIRHNKALLLRIICNQAMTLADNHIRGRYQCIASGQTTHRHSLTGLKPHPLPHIGAGHTGYYTGPEQATPKQA